MSHGKKKWIEAYDGTLKRSNDRTKKDYYRDLKWWDDRAYYTRRWYRYGFGRDKTTTFCPQCKHVQKPIIAEEEAWKARDDELRAVYNQKFGAAKKEWDQFSRRWWQEYRVVEYVDRVTGKIKEKEILNDIRPKIAEPPQFWDWVRKNYPDHNMHWTYHTRSYLCFKCETKYEKKRDMWAKPYPGCNRNSTYTRRQEYRNYRNEVKSIMQKAKYDEEYYDEIPQYKRGWLD